MQPWITIATIFWTVPLGLTLLATVLSYREGERGAGNKLLVLTLLLFLLSLFLITLAPIALAAVSTLSLLLISLLRLPSFHKEKPQQAHSRYDERDVIFSRFKLDPASDRFEAYYRDKPEILQIDNHIRTYPGLLKKGSLYYNREDFEQSIVHFQEVEKLYPRLTPTPTHPPSARTPGTHTNIVKTWLLEQGAHSAGITLLKEAHLYTIKGRGTHFGETISNQHPWAIAFTVEMDHERVKQAPASPMVLESSMQYLRSGTIAVALAALIADLGYDARAHIDGNYELICPLVARDAGLGEIGRMGLLMDPKLGPRCRIAVVTTTLPLLPDSYTPDASVLYFCKYCKKCAITCPGEAIPHQDRKGADGHKRWRISQEKCFEFWCKAGTDCGKCMAICPYAHPNNLLHNTMRWVIRQSPILTRIAIKMDDWLYN